MNNNLPKQLAEKVLSKLKTDKVKMKPKIHFILRTLLIVLGIVVLALFILYLISFVTFTLRASGLWFLPGFGFHGVRILFTSIPWLLVLTALFLIVILETLVERFSFAYRRPILYSTIAIVLIVVVSSFLINKTQFHPFLFRQAQEGRLPPIAGEFYRGFSAPKFQDVHRGVVSEITDDGFRVEMSDGEILEVIVSSETRFPFGTGIKESDTVIILGERDNGTVRASDVRKIDDNLNIPSKNYRPQPRNMIVPHRIPIVPGK